MSLWSEQFGCESDARGIALEHRMRSFYSLVDNYEAYREETSKPEFWLPIRSSIESVIARRGVCKLLEIGAGKTGFAKYLGDVKRRVEFHVQDVIGRNHEYLSAIADKVWLCELTEIHETFDVIFSTFAYEHMTAPRASLDHMLSIMKPSGSLFIASPRYDFPGYLSPSVRHLSRRQQLSICLQLIAKRVRTLCGGPALFLLHLDPAVFHMAWFRDADAVHWPSLWDLKRFLRQRGDAIMQPLRLDYKSLRGAFWARFLLLFVHIQMDDRESLGRRCLDGALTTGNVQKQHSRPAESCLN